ncbi:hypothetical protein [Streptomyces sp. JJ36]|uniref:hypothetical protein n=1 Tax=Streptomyces sp. JJ36 TaxID=2736645 RepID=UPI001F207544|nr:hypothetical protein [Streptomyces sp. JJ36]MCF6525454.1 hypothetical protein [Streptomyces sp. JJ36]
MLNPTKAKAAVVAALLGGFALPGAGLALAQSGPAPTCTQTEDGYRCVQEIERTLTGKNRQATTESSVECSASGRAHAEARGRAVRELVIEKTTTTTECSGSSSSSVSPR